MIPLRRGTLGFFFLIAALLPLPAHATLKLVIVGDNMISGYRVPYDEGFIAGIQQMIDKKKYDVRILDYVSIGMSTADLYAKFHQIADEKPDIIFVAIGLNDALQKLDPSQGPFHYLTGFVYEMQKAGASLLVAGTYPTTNPALSRRYYELFFTVNNKQHVDVYTNLAPLIEGQKTLLVEGESYQPNADGIKHILYNISPRLERLIRKKLADQRK